MSQLLLSTKLYAPQPGKHQVSRPRLLARLAEGRQPGCRLVLVSAPAGYGKTSLVSAWLADQPPGLPAAWLTLDDGDNDPTRFCFYVISALRAACPGVGDQALALLQSPATAAALPGLEIALSTLINDLVASPGAVLVLDDYHAIQAPAIHTLLAFLVDRLPPQVCLVVLTRVDPALPLARLRGRGQVLEMRLNDLRFSTAEAAEYLNDELGLSLSEPAVAALNARAEGWAACLQMAAASLKDCPQPDAFIATFSGSNRYILDYLIEEVLGRQPAAIQAFLERTALLERLCAPLCAAVLAEAGTPGTGSDPQATLAYLESANLFLIPLDDERRWYRYHRLFADLLRKRLGQSASMDEISGLHRRAGRWYAANGHSGPAIDHALLAQDFDLAAHLLEETAEDLWGRGEHEWFLQRLRQLPAEVTQAHPHLSVLQAAILGARGNLTQAEACLQAVEQRLAQGLDPWLVGRAAAVRAQIAVYRGDDAAGLAYSRQALAHLPPDRDFVPRYILLTMASNLHIANDDLAAAARDLRLAVQAARQAHQPFLLVDAITQLAMILWMGGEMRQASAACQQGLQHIQEHGLENVPATNTLLFAWGFLLTYQRRLDEAQAAIQRGLALSGSGSYPWAVVWGRLASLYLALARDDLPAAKAILREADQEVAEHEAPIWIACGYAGLKALTWVRLGQLAEAEAYLDGRGIRPDGVVGHPHLGEYSALAQLLIARRDLDQAAAVLEGICRSAQRSGQGGWLLQSLANRALVYELQGQRAPALQALQQALEVAGAQDYPQTFLAGGPAMAALLAAAAQAGIYPDFIHHLLATIGAPQEGDQGPTLASPAPAAPTSVPPGPVELLSERELEVLRLVAAGLSNKEIANRLFISLRTVKFHTSGIYTRLGVDSRMQAVRRARELGILPKD